MAATVLIRRWTGTTGSETKSDITSINSRANAVDTHSTGETSNPIRKPASGTNYSFWVSTRLDCSVAPAGTIDNIRWFLDGTNNFTAGITMKGNTATTYETATGTAGTSGNQLTTANHAGLDGAPVDTFTHTSGSPKSITGSTTTTGDFGAFFVYQIEASTAAVAGETGTETVTWRYDET
jgi:hypothetical protein